MTAEAFRCKDTAYRTEEARHGMLTYRPQPNTEEPRLNNSPMVG